ncbi:MULTISPECIES: DUF4145 domain-containing protein [Pseudomonas]|uniref:DUF4145 domain-containing protein n=1 Tax=Pseudomonas luteola TaxID=47886 RepID=A0ABS0MXL3_PSELU|nr:MULTISPECIES: DUF4145 domain-containing protein [Pseudomonas]MBA1250375.1 DUF4145 domain-containing protein [Pseudomonas zeshuii]MBH3441447.1 DUF4145 domain-containing protein [Pseudomonas luteola]QEU26609.1 DUF4145 domain-containing protein [Pseudomonas luteola]
MPAFHFIDIHEFGRVTRDREPNFCPHCAHRIAPEELEWNVAYAESYSEAELECTCRCTNQDCRRLFIATYRLEIKTAANDLEKLAQYSGNQRAIFKLDSSYPRYIPKTTFSAEVAELSPQFVEIYQQAETAEALGLQQVCGLGYRKAVEFLVKDFCISQVQEGERQSILSAPLMQCISRFIDDNRVKTVATRAAWLGNDEAHYVRKWVGRDVSDLRMLIRLLCNWIESTLLTSRYEDEMPSNR